MVVGSIEPPIKAGFDGLWRGNLAQKPTYCRGLRITKHSNTHLSTGLYLCYVTGPLFVSLMCDVQNCLNPNSLSIVSEQ